MAVLAPPVRIVPAGAPPFVQVPSGAPPFVVYAGDPAANIGFPITIVADGAPPITLLNEDGSLWSAYTPAGGGVLLVGEANGFATDFLHPVDAERVAVKTAGTVVSSGLSFFTSSGTSSKWVYDINGTLANIPVGTLPLDYDPVTHAARGLLCEPQATNLVLQSSTFENATWAKNSGTVANNVATAPNGLTEADAFVPAVGVANPFVNTAAGVTSGADHTFSIYVKNGTLANNWLRIAIVSTSTWQTWFNLSTGAKGTATGSPTSYTITAVGNGWYRLTTTFLAGSATATVYLAPETGDGSAAGVTGDAVKPAYYPWGAQAEAGTVATSYIPTLAATVTRAADQYNATAASINYSATAGSWWAEVSLNAVLANGRIVGYPSAGGIGPIIQTASTSWSLFDGTAFFGKTVGSTLGVHKVMAAFASGDRALTADGLAPATDATAGIQFGSPGASIGFGNTPPGGDLINGYIRKVRYLPRRPSNAELQTMTA